MKSTKLVLTLLMVLCMCVTTVAFAQDDYTPPPGVPGPGEVDLGGATVTLIGLNLDTRSIWEWGAFWDTFFERMEEAKTLFNCNFAYIHGGNYSDHVLNRILAGESSYDIIINRQAREFGYWKLVQDGMLFPVSDILPSEYFESLGIADRNATEKLQHKGKLYGFGTLTANINNSMEIWAYNKTMLEREGQPDPYELWKNGEWTYEAFEKIAKAVTRDTDGDGVIDQWGAPDFFGDGTAVIRTLPWNGIEITKIDENGKVVFALDSPVAIETINLFKRWRLDEQMLGVGVSGVSFQNGDFAFDKAHAMGFRYAKQSMQDEWAFIPPPKFPDVDRVYHPTFTWRTNFIPANSKDPLGLIAVWSYLVRPDDYLVEEHIAALMRDAIPANRESWEVYEVAIETFQGEGDHFEGTALWSEIVAPALTSVITGEKGAAAAMAEIKPQAQAFLDDLFGQ